MLAQEILGLQLLGLQLLGLQLLGLGRPLALKMDWNLKPLLKLQLMVLCHMKRCVVS
jgi:hypothetical protein